MNRYDKILIVCMLITSILFYIPFVWNAYQQSQGQQEVVVYYKDQEVLRVDLHVNQTYEVEGTLGSVYIEVQDGKVRVEKENSPYHYCSIQGWVKDASEPIVCLPNHIVVCVESKSSESQVDTVIQ